MNFKRNIKRLNMFKKEMAKYSHLEDTNIKPILTWVKERQKKVKRYRCWPIFSRSGIKYYR